LTFSYHLIECLVQQRGIERPQSTLELKLQCGSLCQIRILYVVGL